MLSCGKSSEFIGSLNFDRYSVLDVTLQYFEQVRPRINFGSPFRKWPKLRGRPPSVRYLDLLGLALATVES